MSDSAPPVGSRHRPRGWRRMLGSHPSFGRRPWWMMLGVVAALLAVVALGVAGFSILAAPPPATPAALELVPHAELDRRWGSYLSEREWGTPREAVGADGWALSWSGAIGREYVYGSDGIGGFSDMSNEYRLGWAFWEGSQSHVTERLNGLSNPGGPAGEEITDDRVFHENSPNHSYQRLRYAYPRETAWFSVELETAKFDSTSMTMVATVTNVTTETRSLDVIFKAWMAPAGTVDPVDDGLLLRGSSSVVAVVGQASSDWQITADKGALDENLRADGLPGDQGGHIGALAYHLEIPAGAAGVIRVGAAEMAVADHAEAPAAEAVVVESATSVLEVSDRLVAARRAELDGLFATEVTEHEQLYRDALMTLLWNESFYRWDGQSGVTPQYGGQIDASDVLIMPDKWEFPWPASWDSAFHAVTASLVDAEIAEDQLRFFLTDGWLQVDGHIPCAEWVMASECPPIFAWATWRVYERTNDEEFLREVYPGLQRNYEFWWSNNQVGDALFTGGFLGMDNLPRAHGGRAAQADASGWMALFARDMARIASELGDPVTSERYWVDRGHIQEQINTLLWDDETSFYYDMTAEGETFGDKSYSGLIPLIAGVVPPERLPAILGALRDERQFLSPAGIRSLSKESPLYLPGVAGRGVNSNWRGPVWVPINYMLVEVLRDIDPSLADDVRNRVVSGVEADWQASQRFHEFFDGDTGEGLGADSQGWTTLVANLIRESSPATPSGARVP